MHSSFIWASCNNVHTIEALAQLVNPPVLPRDLPEFFWRHLQRDIEDLSRITAKGTDECAMIVHLVLSLILIKDPPSCELSSQFTTFAFQGFHSYSFYGGIDTCRH